MGPRHRWYRADGVRRRRGRERLSDGRAGRVGRSDDPPSRPAESESAMCQKHTISAWVRNRPGVLTRVASLFRRRLFNIESLTVGHSETPGISRMTIGIDGTNVSVEQVVKQLYKLIDVVKITDVSEEPSIM